ncbi:hypothetical protein Tco_0914027 [Tanacetum coccineum]
MISTGSSTKLSFSSSQSSFIGMTRDSSNKYFFRLEMWKVLWTLLSPSGSSSLYAAGPIRSRILNGPMYRACKRCRICTIFSVVSWIISGPENSTNAKCLSHPFPKSITQARIMSLSV